MREEFLTGQEMRVENLHRNAGKQLVTTASDSLIPISAFLYSKTCLNFYILQLINDFKFEPFFYDFPWSYKLFLIVKLIMPNA